MMDKIGKGSCYLCTAEHPELLSREAAVRCYQLPTCF